MITTTDRQRYALAHPLIGSHADSRLLTWADPPFGYGLSFNR